MFEFRRLVRLTGRCRKAERNSLAIDDKMQFRAESALGSAQGVIGGLRGIGSSGSRGATMGTNHRAIHAPQLPAQQFEAIEFLHEMFPNPIPQPFSLPAGKAIEDRFPGPEVGMQIAPFGAATQHPENAMHDEAVGPKRTSTTWRSFFGKQRCDSSPLLVRERVPFHDFPSGFVLEHGGKITNSFESKKFDLRDSA